MRKQFDLPDGPANYAWGFDCVPEENSLILQFGSRQFELPALTPVHQCAKDLLSEEIVEQFGAEFPIRFNFLDTMDGGNLSLQVHPLRSYIREHFGLAYMQDESYYLVDAGPDATVSLGLREGIDANAMAADLRAAQAASGPFPAEQYFNVWPARKHSHFPIPAGTVHCKTAFEYGPGMYGPLPEMRRLEAIRPRLRGPNCSGPDPVYGIAMVFRSKLGGSRDQRDSVPSSLLSTLTRSCLWPIHSAPRSIG